MTSKIEWCDETWNPMTGCTKISDGCKNCYAERMAKRLAGRYGYPRRSPFEPATYHKNRIGVKLFAKNKIIFVCSMGDLFHERVNLRGDEVREVFRCMAHHDNTFILLTKRPGRMRACIEYLYGDEFAEQMPHVWIGVTAENQQEADVRIPILLQITAAIRFVSIEPMLGPVDFNSLSDGEYPHLNLNALTGLRENPFGAQVTRGYGSKIDWVICGGESGHGARPVHPDWVRLLRDQCSSAEVPFFFKQWGGASKKKNGRLLDGKEYNEYPQETMNGYISRNKKLL